MQQKDHRRRMFRFGRFRYEQIIGALLSAKLKSFFADLLRRNGYHQSNQEKNRSDRRGFHRAAQSRIDFTVSVGRPSTARLPRSTIGLCIKSGCLTISEISSSSLKSFLLNSSSR